MYLYLLLSRFAMPMPCFPPKRNESVDEARFAVTLAGSFSKCRIKMRGMPALPERNIVFNLLCGGRPLVQINPPDMLFDNVDEAQCISGFFIERPLGKPAFGIEEWLDGTSLVVST